MRDFIIAAVIAGVIGGALAFVAGFDAEMNRRRFVLFYEKGVYRGQPDQALSERTQDALRARAAYQAALAVGSAALPVGLHGRNVRAPGELAPERAAKRNDHPY